MRRWPVGAVLAMLAVIVVGGCGDEDSPSDRASAAVPGLHSFDLYVAASADGDVLSADLYGITFDPLTVHRITTDKRISNLAADRSTVVVVAADEQLDKLALVTEGGELVPLPGVGRPHGFSPEVRPNGRIRFEDDGPDDDRRVLGRLLEYDPQTERTRVLFSSRREINLAGTLSGGFLELVHRDNADDQVAIVGDGARRVFRIAPRIGDALVGTGYVAARVYPVDDPTAEPTDTSLLDTMTGKAVVLRGWSPLAWSPDGTRLLVKRRPAAGEMETELGLLDVRRPKDVTQVGVVPALVLYSGAWVSGEAL